MKALIPTILIANGIMDAGGTESLIMEMLRHSTRKVNYIMLIHYSDTLREGLYDKEIKELGYKIVHIPSVGKLGINGYCREFANTISKLPKIDAVHCHLNANAGIICMAAKRCGIQHRISHCHADIHFTGSRKNRIKEEVSLQILRLLIELNATEHWACSDAAWERLFFPWCKRFVIKNMIDVRKYFCNPDDKPKAKEHFNLKHKIILGSVGRVAPIKNIETAISATARLIQRGYDVEYVCFGRFDKNNSYCNSLIKLAEHLGVNSRIKFLGNSNNVARDIKCIDVFLMPSFTEGFGIAALEAQASGIPCVLSDGIPNEVDVQLGLVEFVDSKNIEAWEEAIDKAILTKKPDNDCVLEAFVNAGLDSVSGVENIENKYLEIINGKQQTKFLG